MLFSSHGYILMKKLYWVLMKPMFFFPVYTILALGGALRTKISRLLYWYRNRLFIHTLISVPFDYYAERQCGVRSLLWAPMNGHC